MEVFLPLLDELTPTSDTSNTVSVISELYLKPPVNVVRVRVFLEKKPNDHSLLVFQQQKPKHTKTLIFFRIAGLDAKALMPSIGVQEVHSIGYLVIDEPLLGR
jgi:hypothetical protein